MSVLSSTESGARAIELSTGRKKYRVVSVFQDKGCTYYVGAIATSWGGTGYHVLAYNEKEKRYFRHT